MKRREFFGKTGSGVAGIFGSRLGLSAFKGTRSSDRKISEEPPYLKTIRKDFPPLRNLTYLDTAFVGLMSRQGIAPFLQYRGGYRKIHTYV